LISQNKSLRETWIVKLNTLALATLIGFSILPALLSAAEVPTGPHIITSGSAGIDVVPDIAILTIEVSELNKEAAAAKKQVDQRVVQYFDFLQKQNIDKKDINAANLQTQAEYDYKKSRRDRAKRLSCCASD